MNKKTEMSPKSEFTNISSHNKNINKLFKNVGIKNQNSISPKSTNMDLDKIMTD